MPSSASVRSWDEDPPEQKPVHLYHAKELRSAISKLFFLGRADQGSRRQFCPHDCSCDIIKIPGADKMVVLPIPVTYALGSCLQLRFLYGCIRRHTFFPIGSGSIK